MDDEKKLVCESRDNECVGCPFEEECAAEDVETEDWWGW